MRQKTIKKEASITGYGIHTGKKSKITICPAKEDTGIYFQRVDLLNKPLVKADFRNVVSTNRSTNIKKNQAQVNTIEHLMATFYGLGIDNIMVEVDNEEIPILDGSASPFVYLIKSAGIELQSSRKKFIKILKPIEVFKDDAFVKFLPFNGFKASLQVDFQHPTFNRKNQILEIKENLL